MSLTLVRPIVFFDLETTGTDVQNDRIVQISLLKLYPDNNEEILTLLVNSGVPIPTEASAVHGITYDVVKDELILKDGRGLAS
jgi:DNA polymerase-3 subunit epsilon